MLQETLHYIQVTKFWRSKDENHEKYKVIDTEDMSVVTNIGHTPV